MCWPSRACPRARTALSGSRTPFALLDHLQLRALRFGGAILPRGGRGRRPIRGIGIRIPLGENHALAGLTRVYAQNRPHRDLHREPHTPEACLEADEIVAELQHLSRGEAYIEDDFAVFDVLARHGHAFGGRIHHDVRCLAAVGNPLVQGTKQVRASWLHWRRSCEGSIRQGAVINVACPVRLRSYRSGTWSAQKSNSCISRWVEPGAADLFHRSAAATRWVRCWRRPAKIHR